VESGSHFKNGANPKSHTSRENLKIKSFPFVLFAIIAGGLAFSSCGEDEKESTPDSSGATAPSAPTGVTALALSSSSISVSWSSVAGATGYSVYYATSGSAAKNLAGSASATSYTHTGLSAGTAYYYYVKAVNSAGESGYSSSAYAATQSSGSGGGGETPTKPSAPTGVTAVVNGTSVSISWNSVSGATGYSVYRGPTGSTTSVKILSTASTTATDASPLDGLNYYRVTASNAAGESEQSNFGYCTYADQTPPATPTGVSVKYQNYYLIVSWNAAQGAARYAVWCRRPVLYGDYMEDFLWVDAPTTTRSFQWSTMYLGAYTFWVVAASSNSVNSQPSSKVTYTITQ
jgi:fibronectin type 3 domain-containing protein